MNWARATPLLIQEGWTRHQEEVAKPPLTERTGWSKMEPLFRNAFRNTSAIPTTPSAPLRWLRIFFLMAQPPLLYQEGSGAPNSFTPYRLDSARHPPVDLWIVAHVENVFAYAAELPLAIKGLSPQIFFPYSQVHSPESALPSFRQTQFHQSCRQPAAVPRLIDVETYKLNWIFANYTIRRLIGKKLGVTCQLAGGFGDYEARLRVAQL